MSWKAEVIADSSGKWCGNALVFHTWLEAKEYAGDLASRWFAVRETRVVQTQESVNYIFVDGKLVSVESESRSWFSRP